MSSHFPNATQLDFLKASLLGGDAALSAWGRWKAQIDIERLDVATYRILPLLYLNLRRLGVEDPLLSRLKGAYRFTWVRNQRLQLAAATIARSLSEGGVPVLCFKGLPLVVDCYADQGSRQMQDIDLLVPEASLRQAIDIVVRRGWTPELPQLREPTSAWASGYVKYINGCDFRDQHRQTVDLHWRLYPENCDPIVNQSFWDEAIPFAFGGVEVKTLRHEDMLIHLMVHGSRRNSTPPFRWAADAYMLLQRHGSEIDWRFVCERSVGLDVVIGVRKSLEFLAEHLAVEAAAEGAARLQSVRVTPRAVREYTVNAQQGAIWREASFFWNRYRRIKRTHSTRLTIMGFFRYLQYLGRLDSLADLPGHALYKFKKLLRGVSDEELHAGYLADGRTTLK